MLNRHRALFLAPMLLLLAFNPPAHAQADGNPGYSDKLSFEALTASPPPRHVAPRVIRHGSVHHARHTAHHTVRHGHGRVHAARHGHVSHHHATARPGHAAHHHATGRHHR